ncbi:NrsF family protein [Mesorhizobium sp. BAC0120]|uniref:NrsF family protein n=1 Tax=Mesorhizobium sp. BAC0120 TaxID=3090670 RepID=UPI00298BE730|nr:NrsF family protein [Mesorhizobium sp. BAC0120]MDW6025167.1 NrsF family protein [Mesorhizobium sp. BAC0120]
METGDLIKLLAADARRQGPSFGRAWSLALALAVIIAAAIFFGFIGPRPDIATAAQTMRFPFKFVVTGLLALTALAALVALSRPEASGRGRLVPLAAAPLLLVAAVALELAVIPSADWAIRLVGTNNRYCLSLIPLMGIGPLALFILALRNAAPTRPALAGAVAGLAAGGIAATLYAAHCTDDSPLFVVTWYTLAIAMLTLAGAFGGRVFVRW